MNNQSVSLHFFMDAIAQKMEKTKVDFIGANEFREIVQVRDILKLDCSS